MKKITINALRGFFALSLLFGSFSIISNGQEMKKDEMKKDSMPKDAMKKDEMKKDEMKKDEMMKTEMSKDSMKKDEMAMEDKRPIVAIIGADWCPYCKKLDPIMKSLMADYGEKLNFVMFDITNDATIEASMKLAKEKGLEDFFNENKGKSAFVAIMKDGKQVFESKYKTDKKVFMQEFDKVLK
jgi:pentapeptide MXKDX repeat protein